MAADRTNCRGRQEASGSSAHVKPVSLASLAPRARATCGEPALELQPRVTPRRTLRTTGSAEAAPRPRGRCEACGTAPPAPKGERRAGPSERTRTAHCRWKALRSWEVGWLDGHTVEEGPAVAAAVGDERSRGRGWSVRGRFPQPGARSTTPRSGLSARALAREAAEAVCASSNVRTPFSTRKRARPPHSDRAARRGGGAAGLRARALGRRATGSWAIHGC